jgi:hypothetical protein
LVAAAGLVGVEGCLVLAYAGLEAASVHADRAAMGITTSLFFCLLGGALLACAWFVGRGRAWARSPILMAQLLFLGLAWNFLGGQTTWVSVVLGAAALLVLGGLLHPASIRALSESRDDTP